MLTHNLRCLLASPQGGVAERLRNCAKHPLRARPGWFSDENNKENHPGCVCFGGFAIFFDDTATPPCGDARRGLSPDSDLFTASLCPLQPASSFNNGKRHNRQPV